MTVTVTYSLGFKSSLDIATGPAHFNAEVTSLANGGFAASGDAGSNTALDYFKPNGGFDHSGGPFNSGAAAAIDELSNGNFVMATTRTASDSIWFAITSPFGTGGVDLGDTSSSNPDVTALTGGGAWVVYQDLQSGSNSDIEVNIRNSDGNFISTFIVDSAPAEDHGPSAAGLDDGTVAVAWTRTIGAGTEVWYAAYNETGGVIRAPALLDSTGPVNRNVSVSAKSGGFVVAYEDDGWGTGGTDITLAQFTLNGTFERWDNVSNPLLASDVSDDANPYVARLSNDYLVVAYTNSRPFEVHYTAVRLIDPASGNIIAEYNLSDPVKDTRFPAVAGFSNGGIAVFHTNDEVDDIEGAHLQARRTSVGDIEADLIDGDSLADTMRGGGGNDHLRGFGGNDRLIGGPGRDRLDGGTGRDVMTGDGGADAFAYTATADSGITVSTRDHITDFVHLTDKIDLSAIDASTGTPGNNGFTFKGTLAFDGEGQVRVVQSGSNTIVEVNTTGAAGAEMTIQLNNVTASALTLADFFF